MKTDMEDIVKIIIEQQRSLNEEITYDRVSILTYYIYVQSLSLYDDVIFDNKLKLTTFGFTFEGLEDIYNKNIKEQNLETLNDIDKDIISCSIIVLNYYGALKTELLRVINRTDIQKMITKYDAYDLESIKKFYHKTA